MFQLVDGYSVKRTREQATIEGEKKGEKKKAINMAKKMLAKNKPIDEIIEFTDLTEKEIIDIKKIL